MDEWTLTTEQVRAEYENGVWNDGLGRSGPEVVARFDHWLAMVKREAMAEALEEFAEKWAVQDGIEVLMFARDDVSAVQLTETVLIARAAEYRTTPETGEPRG